MKEKKLRECATCDFCHNKIGHSNVPMFFRLRVQRYTLNGAACQEQQGLGLMIGAQLAQVMGPDRDLAEKTDEKEFTVCYSCSLENDFCIFEDGDESSKGDGTGSALETVG